MITSLLSLMTKPSDSNNDGFAKSPKTLFSVIPAKAGIQEYQGLLDPGFRRGDAYFDFLP